MRFARAYTESPVCVSARATLLTGRLPHRSGVFDNGYRLSPELPTLPALLRRRGYHGQAIGKMHFSPVREQHGLHRMWLSEEIPATPAEDEFLAHLLDAGWGHVEEPHGVRHEMYYLPQVSQLPQELHTTAWTGQRTVAYLEERARERGREAAGGQPTVHRTARRTARRSSAGRASSSPIPPSIPPSPGTPSTVPPTCPWGSPCARRTSRRATPTTTAPRIASSGPAPSRIPTCWPRCGPTTPRL